METCLNTRLCISELPTPIALLLKKTPIALDVYNKKT